MKLRWEEFFLASRKDKAYVFPSGPSLSMHLKKQNQTT
jgi:hypothetical protein